MGYVEASEPVNGLIAPNGSHSSDALQARTRITILYHYFHPDDVVSAKHYADLAEELAARGWRVEAHPCNRGCRDEKGTYPLKTRWRGVCIRRVWRPHFRQSSILGRILNALWMIVAWSAILIGRKRRDAEIVVIGTDPILSPLVAWIVKKFRPRVRIVHWCFDIYPEAAVADDILSEHSSVYQLLSRLVRASYRSCDLIVDLGSCMRSRLEDNANGVPRATFVPWGLKEPETWQPPDDAVRRELFGNAPLTLLYSGNFGRAHDWQGILQLAREVRCDDFRICFAIRGNCIHEVRAVITAEDTNVSFARFVPESKLVQQLCAADIHLVSLRQTWTGLVVPSKFFGSLAVGRPVIFAGSRDAAIAHWIEEHGIGWVLDRDSLPQVASELRKLAAEKDKLHALQQHCHEIYRKHFCKRHMMERWNEELLKLARY